MNRPHIQAPVVPAQDGPAAHPAPGAPEPTPGEDTVDPTTSASSGDDPSVRVTGQDAAAIATVDDDSEATDDAEPVLDPVDEADPEDAAALVELPAQPTVRSAEREAARALFHTLAELPADSPQRSRLRDKLVETHLPLVEHLARRFRNRGEPLDDLIQVGTIGLIKSVDRFDLGRGVEFSTYATPTIVGEIKRHFRDKGWAVRVPRRLQELRLSMTATTAELTQRNGRAPTVHELAVALEITDEEVLEGLESANAYSTLSLDAPEGSGDDSFAVADTLGSEDEALVGVEYRESLKPLLAKLAPREKKILLLRFFGNKTQSEIAAEVGISQMHVSRLLARTLGQLREGLLDADERRD